MFRITDPRITHIKVGPGETTAPYRIDDPAAFRQFLRQAFGQRPNPEKGA
jgi:hypothetical protein